MLSEELSTDMDRITQLQDAILDLLTISATAIDYITKRTQFEQVSTAIPATVHTAQAAKRVDYKGPPNNHLPHHHMTHFLPLTKFSDASAAAIETFTADIVRRSKDVELLIAALPAKDGSGERAKRLEELQVEMGVANTEYRDALDQAEELLQELQMALATALGDVTQKAITSHSNSLPL